MINDADFNEIKNFLSIKVNTQYEIYEIKNYIEYMKYNNIYPLVNNSDSQQDFLYLDMYLNHIFNIENITIKDILICLLMTLQGDKLLYHSQLYIFIDKDDIYFIAVDTYNDYLFIYNLTDMEDDFIITKYKHSNYILPTKKLNKMVLDECFRFNTKIFSNYFNLKKYNTILTFLYINNYYNIITSYDGNFCIKNNIIDNNIIFKDFNKLKRILKGYGVQNMEFNYFKYISTITENDIDKFKSLEFKNINVSDNICDKISSIDL